MRMPSYLFRMTPAILLLLCLPGLAIAADGKSTNKKSKSSLGLGLGLGNDSLIGNPYSYEASYEAEEGGQRGRVQVRLTLDDSHHTFSTTQQPGGPAPTVISIATPGISLAGPFVPDSSPESAYDVVGFENLRVEMHHGTVTWTAPVTFATPLSSSPLPISLKVDAQVCNEACIPIRDLDVLAKFTSFYDSPNAAASKGPFRESSSPVEWTVTLDKSAAKPGDTVNLVLSAHPDEGYHIYKFVPFDTEPLGRTLIVLTKKANLLAGVPTTSSKLIHNAAEDVDYYAGDVSWKIPLTVSELAEEGIYPLQGLIGYLGCTDQNCDQPRGIRFQVDLNVGSLPNNEPLNASLVAVPFNDVKANEHLADWIDGSKIKLTLTAMEILAKFGFAVLGGLILNFMPCVLPVIGLKVLGFVSESDGKRSTATLLTLTYAAGIVFLILALGVLSVVVRHYTGQAFGWGQQFGSLEFRIIITAFMFSLALSFLGVWEIPIPGFAMSKTSTELSNREGYVGAFCKGLITTVLATPCSAPFLGGVFVVALSQPAWVVLLIFAGVGLGMALPYLAIALNPSVMSLLPKPGPWMETFKEFLAFPMLMAVVFLVSGFLDKDRMAMLSALMFVWFACWLFGRVPAWAEWGTKLRTWAIGSLVAIAGTVGSFYYLQPSRYQLAWQPYDEAKLDALVAEGKTVMIDFTANWCQNCQVNLRTALETKNVKELLKADGIVPMVADMTEYPPNIRAKLQELNSNAIPVLAIYSGSNPDKPNVLRDLVTESQVIAALKAAGPSKKPASMPTATSDTNHQAVQ